ncbi:pilus assembly PilX N-terminal domain-containing protein [Rummeliibacillus sp. SL167]|uniref:pilus assembly PilX N-terminal domain-containing protein n=1 Tax=Rummeliibacillus sp. SL167 TaxID=2579792 RepID=UPI0011B3615A|nr:pilus assembly PilX N-terminal domain-containing protein [Rummeliibacillus sp. SL167]
MKKLLYLKSYLNNKHGYTLIIAVLTLVVISILGLGLMGTSATTLKQADHERSDQSAYYIAEAGIVQTKSKLDTIVNNAYDQTKNEYDNLTTEQKINYNFEQQFYTIVENNIRLSTYIFDNFDKNFNEQPTATVTVSRINNSFPIQYDILSVGKIGKNKRTLSQNYTVTLNANITEKQETKSNKYAVHVSNTLKLSGSANIFDGEVATESSDIKNISIPDYYTEKPKINITTPIEISLPPFPDNDFSILEQLPYPANKVVQKNQYESAFVIKNHDLLITHYLTNGYQLDMTTDMKFDNIILNSNYTLVINVGNTDKKILVNHLDVTNGHIKIIGSGKLTFYVENQITTGSGSTINSQYIDKDIYDNSSPGDISKLKIYYKGKNAVDMDGAQKIYGSLYAQQADVHITAGAGFQGDIYTGGQNVSVSGGTNVYSQIFLAPHANFSLSGGGKIKGTIISNSFEASGGSSVFYDPTNSVGGTTTIKIYGDANKLTTVGDMIEK